MKRFKGATSVNKQTTTQRLLQFSRFFICFLFTNFAPSVKRCDLWRGYVSSMDDFEFNWNVIIIPFALLSVQHCLRRLSFVATG